MQSIPAIPCVQSFLGSPISFRKMSKLLLRVYKVLMNWILLISQQNLLPQETLNSTLQLNESFPVSQTQECWAYKHATTYSPRTPFLPRFHLSQVHASRYLPLLLEALLHVMHLGQMPFRELSFPIRVVIIVL